MQISHVNLQFIMFEHKSSANLPFPFLSAKPSGGLQIVINHALFHSVSNVADIL